MYGEAKIVLNAVRFGGLRVSDQILRQVAFLLTGWRNERLFFFDLRIPGRGQTAGRVTPARQRMRCRRKFTMNEKGEHHPRSYVPAKSLGRRGGYKLMPIPLDNRDIESRS